MILTPASTVCGHRVVQTFGLVKGNTIRARHVGKDIIAAFKNLVGGEIEEYTKMMAESREQALDRMQAEARSLGADAVLGVATGAIILLVSVVREKWFVRRKDPYREVIR